MKTPKSLKIGVIFDKKYKKIEEKLEKITYETTRSCGKTKNQNCSKISKKIRNKTVQKLAKK